MPRLTCIVIVYNRERYLKATLESLVNQTRKPDLVIVQDNCSTDGTKAVFEQFRKFGFEWRQNETNIGFLGNFSRALDYASETEYLHLLPADDVLKPRFFERSLPSLETVPGRGLVYSPYEIIDSEGKLLGAEADIACPFVNHSGQDKVIPQKPFLATQATLNGIGCLSVIMKTAYKSLPVKIRNLAQYADCMFWAEWGMHCEKIVEVGEVLSQYRRHSECISYENLNNIEAYVREEWQTMNMISTMLKGNLLSRWLRYSRLKCILAARAQVKHSACRKNPELLRRAHKITQEIVGPLHWRLGGLAVVLRDFYRGIKGTKLNGSPCP